MLLIQHNRLKSALHSGYKGLTPKTRYATIKAY